MVLSSGAGAHTRLRTTATSRRVIACRQATIPAGSRRGTAVMERPAGTDKAFSERDLPPGAPETQRTLDTARRAVDAKAASNSAQVPGKHPQISAAQEADGDEKKSASEVTEQELGGGAEPGAAAEKEMTSAVPPGGGGGGGGGGSEEQQKKHIAQGGGGYKDESDFAAGVQDVDE